MNKPSQSIDDYQNGVVVCHTCSEPVSFRDPLTGGFTLRLWDSHRAQCRMQHSPPDPILLTPQSSALAQPQNKKRRAKRNEEERIDYLRTDPLVAQFEPYRVLCASCNKWIRLRPNSTYCSIPWDAHRRSCLSKKGSMKFGYALEERVQILRADPDVLDTDASRVHCGRCGNWIQIGAENHGEAIATWFAHREACRGDHVATSTKPENSENHSTREDPPIPNPDAAGSSGDAATSPRPAPQHTISSRSLPPGSPNAVVNPKREPHNASAPTETDRLVLSPEIASSSTRTRRSSVGTHEHRSPSRSSTIAPRTSPSSHPFPGSLTPPAGLVPPPHESRRRNAEQREAALRADPLLSYIEPNRVFCRVCSKWVQLRQDSSFCAYPWVQHRGKCLKRRQRCLEKAAAREATTHAGAGVFTLKGTSSISASAEAYSHAVKSAQVRTSGGGGSVSGGAPPDAQIGYRGPAQDLDDDDERMDQDDPESEEGVEMDAPSAGPAEADIPKRNSLVHSPSRARDAPRWYPASGTHRLKGEDDYGDEGVPRKRARGEGDDPDDRYARYEHHGSSSHQGFSFGSVVLARPKGLADLDSVSGRTTFVERSIEYLFTNTYESTDELSVSTLINYLNAAMPPDKHEDFDNAEVMKAVAELHTVGLKRLGGRVLFDRESVCVKWKF